MMKRKTAKKQYLSLLAFSGAAALTSAIGGIGTALGVEAMFYQAIRPSWAPPGWLFGPVWTTLYMMIAFSGWLVWLKRDEANIRPAMVWYIAQLALNALWPLLFFLWQAPLLAFLEIIILWIAILVTTLHFFHLRKISGWLLLPYLSWVGFATILNFALWRLNS